MHLGMSTSARFLFRNISMDTCFCSFFDKLICYAVPPTHLWLMHHSRMCAQMNGAQQPVYSAPSEFSGMVHLSFSLGVTGTYLLRFFARKNLTIGGYIVLQR